MKSPFAISSWGGRRKFPYDFTEQGVEMLSSVLNGSVAINVNIQVTRILKNAQLAVASQRDVVLQPEKIEQRLSTHDDDIRVIFKCLKLL